MFLLSRRIKWYAPWPWLGHKWFRNHFWRVFERFFSFFSMTNRSRGRGLTHNRPGGLSPIPCGRLKLRKFAGGRFCPPPPQSDLENYWAEFDAKNVIRRAMTWTSEYVQKICISTNRGTKTAKIRVLFKWSLYPCFFFNRFVWEKVL